MSSANSINWGRLLPQIIYYVSAYIDLMAQNQVSYGEPINIVVPTGNFGNILAAYYAGQMGVPINKLICASNANNVLTEFLQTGTYNRNRHFYKTMSPSMDILISSNQERLLNEEAAGLEKARLERQGEQDRLKMALLNKALKDEKSLPEQAAPSQWQPPKEKLKEKETDIQLQSRITEGKPILQDEADLTFEEQSPKPNKKEPEIDSRGDFGSSAIRPKEPEPKKPNWADPSTQKDQVILGSPFGKMSPEERRKMLEAMQVRAKQTPHGSPRRKR
jgi:hypothetical protein